VLPGALDWDGFGEVVDQLAGRWWSWWRAGQFRRRQSSPAPFHSTLTCVPARVLVCPATKNNTSETLGLQRYFEIAPSVNRTAVGIYAI
jgi:hypothetical protein